MKKVLSFILIILSVIMILTSCTLINRHKLKVKNEVLASCESVGYKEYYCKHCDESYVADFVDALGHTWGEGTPIVEADCTSRGIYEGACLRCGEKHRYSVNANGHSYIEVSNDGWTIAYECEVCHDVVNIAGEEKLQDYISATEVFDVEPTFTFNIITSENEAYIKDNLKIIDSYFYGSEFENDPDAVVNYTLTSNGNNSWTVSYSNGYVYDTTYLAKVSGGIRFEAYKGREMSFTIMGDPDHENAYEYKDGIVFLKSLIGDTPYSVKSAENGVGFYLILEGNADALARGQILCVGDISSLEEITIDTECYFGVVDSIYNIGDGKWMVTLAEPEIQTIFKEFDIAFNDDINLSDANVDEAALKENIMLSLYANEEFIEFLSAVKVSSEQYISNNGYYSSNLNDTQSFLNSVEVNPSISFNGNKLTTKIEGSITLDIENASGVKIGTLTIGFEFDIESQLKIDVNYDIKTEWKGVKLEKFDVALTQTDKISFNFRVSVDCDEISNSGYVINKNTGEAHLACCVEVTRSNDSSIFAKATEEEVDAANEKCAHCKPQDGASLEDDFNGYYMNTLYCSDWEKVANDIATLSKSSKDATKVDVKLGSIVIPICGPVRVNIDLGIALSFDARAIMDYSYSYTQDNVYGMRLNHSFLQPYSQMSNGEVEDSNLSVLGTTQVRVGLSIDSHVNISGFEKWINAGVKAEIGAYAELNGVFDVDREYYGAYLELGAYLDIDAYYKLIKKDDSIDLAEIKRALKRYGNERLYFAFDTYYDTIDINCSLDIAESNILVVRYFDLVNMVIKSDELSLSENSKYRVNISFADGRYCEIRNGKIVAKSGAPETFSDTIIIKVESNNDWKNFRKNNEVYYFGEYRIDFNFDRTQGHSYSEWEKSKEPECFANGEMRRVCSGCDNIETQTIPSEHSFQYVESHNITVCSKCRGLQFNNHFYMLYTNKSTWHNSKTQCESKGGHLVTITSAEEQTAIEMYLQYLSQTGYVWIGGYRSDGTFHWVTGEVFEYTHWRPGEPDRAYSDQNYIQMNWGGFGYWNDHGSSETMNFICEWETE